MSLFRTANKAFGNWCALLSQRCHSLCYLRSNIMNACLKKLILCINSKFKEHVLIVKQFVLSLLLH